jgi:murein DD-endopeptidase MepM/ murein hydrolase activator NlpD
MKRKYWFSVCFVVLGMLVRLSAQKPVFASGYLVYPIDSTLPISGNYGELRPNHFHAGIDFSTNNQMNLPVYSVAEGYVSRVKISSTGYGRSVYITHTNGLVSVYGHLNRFIESIQRPMKALQLQKQSYDVELYFKAGEIPIRKKQIIGLSGNSGNSTGPHLHFEIRDAVTETPYNPLYFYSFSDPVKPFISALAFFDLQDTLMPKFLEGTSVKYSKKNKDSLLADKDTFLLSTNLLGFAFQGSDKMKINGSENNIHMIDWYLDGSQRYTHVFKAIDFKDHRYINEYSSIKNKWRLQKCFMPSVYPEKFYDKPLNKGRIVLTDTNAHQLKLIATDENGNQSEVTCYIKAKERKYWKSDFIVNDCYVNCKEDFIYRKNNLTIYIPANTLYNSTNLILENTIATTGKLIILPTEANLNSTAIIGFKAPDKYRNDLQHVVMQSNNTVFPPIISGDSLFYSVKNFGWFNLAKDTTPPSITCTLPKNKVAKQKKWNTISFIIKDQMSGINNYALYINNAWVLAEFDLKENKLSYTFDEETPKGLLNLRVEASDKCKNKKSFELNIQNN